MRALVFTEPSVVELQDVPEPDVEDGEVLVEVVASGICGSELHGIRHADFRKPPLIMGHEFAGRTPDGRRVTVNPLIHCGDCDMCERSQEHLCRNRVILGIHRPGAFAERIAVPASSLHSLPEGMSFEAGAMIEPIANAVHALRLAAPTAGSRIAVLGAGTIGLVSLLVALQYSADVTVCDLDTGRLELAKKLGAAETTQSLNGEFDVVIDAVGAGATHRASVEILRPGGVAVWIGLLSADAGFDGQEVVRDEKSVLGSYCYQPADFEAAVNLASTFDLSWTRSFEMDEAADIFTALMNGRGDVVKALLLPNAG